MSKSEEILNKIQIKIFKGFWTSKIVQSQPECLFIFGDNDIHKGKRGQSVIRDCPNTIGIPTKKYPSMRISSFYTDTELEQNKNSIQNAIDIIKIELKKYKFLVFSEEGLGTGLAKLPEKAPLTYKFLLKSLKTLKNLNK